MRKVKRSAGSWVRVVIAGRNIIWRYALYKRDYVLLSDFFPFVAGGAAERLRIDIWLYKTI
jgi:hypothetical protein